jgi:glycosyltransferase involved in cell wall biosynthesis
VIAVSQAVAESVRRSGVFESSKVTVVHNGIDTDRFDQAKARDATVLIGTVGHLAPIKGFDTFLRAAKLVSPRRPDVRFVIIGEDKSPQMEHRRSLEDLITELGLSEIVNMPGWQDDMPAVLSSLKLFVSAARSEPFGLAIVEAMAAGLPIVATSSEGALEIIEDGITGKLVPTGDAESLAQAINALLDDPLAAVDDRKRCRAAHPRSSQRRDPRSRHPVPSQRDESRARLVLSPGWSIGCTC